MFALFSYFFIKKYKEQRNGGKRKTGEPSTESRQVRVPICTASLPCTIIIFTFPCRLALSLKPYLRSI